MSIETVTDHVFLGYHFVFSLCCRIVHLLITVAFQFWLMRDLEKMAGASRIAIIYLGSGMVGNLASAIFVPNRAEVGPAGSHFGLLACCIVEVIHQWPSLKYPEMAILKLVGVTAVFFLSGDVRLFKRLSPSLYALSSSEVP